MSQGDKYMKAWKEFQELTAGREWTQEEAEYAAELEKNIVSVAENALEQMDELRERFNNTLEDVRNKQDDIMDGFSYLSNITDSISNLWEMAGEMYDSSKL